MSTSGNVIAVSAWSEDGGAQTVNGDESDNTKGFAGAAYIMERTSSWAQTTYVKASNSDASDYFGWSIALSGDGNTLAVGAPKEDGNGTTESNNSSSSAGAVYVFVRAGNTWVQQAYLKAGVVDNGDNFGESVALSENGDVLAVGAQLEDGSSKGLGGDPNDDMAQGSGAAYVFNRSGTTWGAPVYIKGSNTEAGDQFGIRVALSGDGGTLAVTAGLEDSAAQSVGGDQNDNTATSAGAVYVFTGSGSSWSQQAYIKGSAQAREHYFGFATDLDADGNTLVVGAHGGDAAYVFRRTTNTWSEQALLRAVNYPQATGDFGDAVAISSDGNTVAVTIAHERGTASGVDGDYTMLGSSQSGATYLLNYSGGGWQPLSYIKATNPSVGNLFGFAVDLSGDAKTVLVGDTSEKSIATGINGDQLTIGATSSGAAYVYRAF